MEPRVTPDSPSALLERAAAMIEDMAKVADMGPYRVDVLPASCAIKTGHSAPYPGDHLANVGNRFTAQWIATMSPAVAQPLVEWLRAEAEYIKGIRSWKYLPGNTRRAVAFARLVLGEEQANA